MIALLVVALRLGVGSPRRAAPDSWIALLLGTLAGVVVLLGALTPAHLWRAYRSLADRSPVVVTLDGCGIRIEARDGVGDEWTWSLFPDSLRESPPHRDDDDLPAHLSFTPSFGAATSDAIRAMCPQVADVAARRTRRMGAYVARVALISAAIGEGLVLVLRAVIPVPFAPAGSLLALGLLLGAGTWLLACLPPDYPARLAWRTERRRRRRRRLRARRRRSAAWTDEVRSL